ncbi:MAG: GYDIA family GHMP kinase [Bacteroidetes bacterium]|nr:GYDIA family GHMP kinase [Bacteroidota bacterium]MDA0860086.1 GYDIA family GHMP kinase [Bacteroidota bacterium]MDA1318183.1 GYDIA family GHMP kinase [Bacteroidota bacterium]
MEKFYSHGKLLITAEYAVLNGAKALALPTKFGQTLEVKPIESPEIRWKSFDHKGILWFEMTLQLPNFKANVTNETAKRLSECFLAIAKLQPNFFAPHNGFEMHSHLEFPQNWGLGSSSTLINNLAQWANVDAFALLENTFGGSGYDIACAQHPHPIIYQRQNSTPHIKIVDFDPPFKDELFFVHRNQKQNSREAIAQYNTLKTKQRLNFSELNALTEAILVATTLKEFEVLISKHETIVGTLIQQQPLKTTHFTDYPRAVKSLGAWGGDFFLATGTNTQYFKDKGYTTIFPFKEMVNEK